MTIDKKKSPYNQRFTSVDLEIRIEIDRATLHLETDLLVEAEVEIGEIITETITDQITEVDLEADGTIMSGDRSNNYQPNNRWDNNRPNYR